MAAAGSAPFPAGREGIVRGEVVELMPRAHAVLWAEQPHADASALRAETAVGVERHPTRRDGQCVRVAPVPSQSAIPDLQKSALHSSAGN